MFCVTTTIAEDAVDAELREEQVVARFWDVLCKTPRFGTAFDRVYTHHLDRGTLDALSDAARERIAAFSSPDSEADSRENAQNDAQVDPKELGRAELLYGLILLRRNQVDMATEALRRAEPLLEDDSYVSWILSEAYLSRDRLKDAAEALERATTGKASKADQLKIYHTLGTVYEKLGVPEKAAESWARLEKAFPDDTDILARIAMTQEREGKYDEALKRYEKLVVLSESKPERRFRFQLAVADLEIRLGRRQEALRNLNALLDAVSGSGWSSDSVRNRIESLFLRQADDAGLVAFYEKRIEKHPEDVESLRRLALLFARMSRDAEAKKHLEQGIARSPSHVPLRLALADLLETERDFTQARKQYEKIHELAPAHPDVLIRWGRTFLRNKDAREAAPEKNDREQAFAIWDRLIENAPGDVPTLLLVADLCTSENMSAEAENLLQKAVELKPDDMDLYEKLGRFYQKEKEREKAVAVLEKMVDGPRRNADSLLRLGDVFHSLDMPDEAVRALSEAVEREPNRFELRMRLVEILDEKRDFEAVGTQLAAAEKLVESDEERNLFVPWEVRWLKSSRKLDERIATLEKERELEKTDTHDPSASGPDTRFALRDWKLSLLYLSRGDAEEAARCIERALQAAPESRLLLRTAAEIVPQTDDYRRAERIFRLLIEKDTARRSDHLKNLALIRREFGDAEGAVAAARDLTALGAGNALNRRFLAEILFSCGKIEEGVAELRNALRVEPNDRATLEMLADSLFRLGRSDEAIEMAWRVYERSGTPDAQRDCMRRLAGFHSQTRRLDELIGKLRATGDTAPRRRESAFCVAHVYRLLGDYENARKTLESLLDETDPPLLRELSALAELQGDRDGAIRFQEMLCERDAAPGDAGRLLVLYENAGAKEKATLLSAKIDADRRLTQSPLSASRPEDSAQKPGTGERIPAARDASKGGFDDFAESLRGLEPPAWSDDLSREENRDAYFKSLDAARRLFREIVTKKDVAVEEPEFERMMDAYAKTGEILLREAVKDIFRSGNEQKMNSRNENLRNRIDTTAKRWADATDKVSLGPRTLRVLMTIRNEKSIALLEKEARSREHPTIDRKFLDDCDRVERLLYDVVKRQNDFDRDLTEMFENRFPLAKIENRSPGRADWFSLAALKRSLNRALDSREELAKNVNPNLISYLLSRSRFSMPPALRSIPDERLLETACGTLAAIDDFLASESSIEKNADAFRTDRRNEFLAFLDKELKSSKRMEARKIFVREIDAASRPETPEVNAPETAAGIREPESLQSLKTEAQSRLCAMVPAPESALNSAPESADPIPIFSALVLIALAENEADTALDYLSRIPCRTPSDIKARDLLTLRISRRFDDTENRKKNRDVCIDRLLGYRLSEDELFEFWNVLKALRRGDEAAAIRNRLVATASKPAVLSGLLEDLGTMDGHGAQDAEQAVFLALKVLQSGALAARDTKLSDRAVEILARHDKLGEVLDRFEARVKNVPGSVEFAERLADLYLRLERRDDARELAGKIDTLLAETAPDDTDVLFRFVALLERLEMQDEVRRWTKKALSGNPGMFFRNNTQYAETLGNAGMLDVLEEIDVKTVSQNAYAAFRIVETAATKTDLRADALEQLRRIWTAEGLTVEERNRLRTSGVRTFFIENDPAYAPYASDWLMETLGESSGEAPDVFRLWSLANHDPRTVAGSLLELVKTDNALDALFERIREIGRQHENLGEARDWNRYTSTRILEAAILFDRNAANPGLRILDELENRPECRRALESASLFLGIAIETLGNRKSDVAASSAVQADAPTVEQLVARSAAYYEQAFRANPHRAYEPFFTCKLYALYLRSGNPEIRERGLQATVEKLQNVFRMLEESTSRVSPSGHPARETLVFLVEKLGANLIEAGRAETLVALFQERMCDRDWFETFKTQGKNEEEREKSEKLAAALSAVLEKARAAK